ncbi:MAG TPA: hypothetical protein VIO32_11205 [Candidatus Baltobacteraceae bacterium]
MRHLIASAAVALSVLIAAAPALAAPYAGAQYAGIITTTVNTKDAYTGEPVTLNNVTSEDGSVKGAHMYGTVTRVVRAGQGRPAQLRMTFTKLVLPSGATYAIDGVVTGMQSQTKSNALKEIGGAVAGMIVGNIIGKTIFHASGGMSGFLGAAGGYLVAKNNRENMTVPSGSAVRVTLRTVHRQAHR